VINNNNPIYIMPCAELWRRY